MLKAKIERDWEDWEYNNPEVLRAGFERGEDKIDCKKLLENQFPWWLEWIKKTEGALQIYHESPRELRIDPTYSPAPERYSWEAYKQMQERRAESLNYPKITAPEHFTEILKHGWWKPTALTLQNSGMCLN